MVKDRGHGLSVDVHRAPRFLQQIAVGMRQQHDRFLRMADAIRGEARLVMLD